MTDFSTNTTSGLDSMYSLVTGPYVFFAVLTFIISTTLIIVIFSYLNNVSLLKECVLLYLYKDVAIMFILKNCIRLFCAIVWYSNRSGLEIGPTKAKVISFVQVLLSISILILINIINAVKCYIIKSKVLDPPVPWGDDDFLGINIIRLAYSFFTSGFGSVIYAFGLYPELYCALVEPQATVQHLAECSYIIAGIKVVLSITGTITGVVAKVYEAESNQLLDAIIAPQINYCLGIFPTILILLLILTVYLIDFFSSVYIDKHTANYLHISIFIVRYSTCICFL